MSKGVPTIKSPPTERPYGIEAVVQDDSGNWSIYEMAGASEYKLQLEGVATGARASAQQESGGDGGPPIQAILPRIYDNVVWIVALSLAVLAAGFVLLYRNGRRLDAAVKKPR